MTTMVDDISFSQQCNVNDATDYGYGDAVPSTTSTDPYGYGDTAKDLGYGDVPSNLQDEPESTQRRRTKRRGSVTKYSIEAQNNVKEEYDAHSKIINQFRGEAPGSGTPAPPADVTPPREYQDIEVAPRGPAFGEEESMPLNDATGHGVATSISSTSGTRKSGAGKYLRKKNKKKLSNGESFNSSSEHSSDTASSTDSVQDMESSPFRPTRKEIRGEEGPIVSADRTGTDNYGYGKTSVDATKYGYGDAESCADKYGYGEASNDAGINDLGYGDCAPDSRNNGLGYGSSHTSGSADSSSGPRRPRRRGSVTKYSIEAQNTVQEEFDAHANIISQFRTGGAVPSEDSFEVTMPLNDGNSGTNKTDDMSEDGLSGDEMSCEALSDDDLASADGGKKKSKKKGGRLGRFRIGRNFSNMSSKSSSSRGEE